MNKILIEDITRKVKIGEPILLEEKKKIESIVFQSSFEEKYYRAIKLYCILYDPNKENVKIIEKFLSFNFDDLIVSSAISGVCIYWNLYSNNLFFLKEIVQTQYSINYSESQISAFRAIGCYLYENKKDKKTLSYLFNLFKTELTRYEKDKNIFLLESRLDQIYCALQYAIWGREALRRHRVGRTKFPQEINEDLMIEIIEMLK